MLRVSGLFKTYDGMRHTPPPVTFVTDSDTRLAFVEGPNGCGKTTLLKLLSGEETPTGGSFRMDAKNAIAVIYQRDGLLPEINALDNLRLLGCSESAIAEGAHQVALPPGILLTTAKSLSGGEEKRLQFLRARLSKRRLWLIDEPTAHADRALRQLVVSIVFEHLAARGTAVIVTHDEDFRADLTTKLGATCNWITVPIANQQTSGRDV